MTNRNASVTLTLSGPPAIGKDLLFAQFLPVLERFGLAVAPVIAGDAHAWNIWNPEGTVAHAIVNAGEAWTDKPVPTRDPDGLTHHTMIKDQDELRRIVSTAEANGRRSCLDTVHKDFAGLCKAAGLNPAEASLNELVSKVRADAVTEVQAELAERRTEAENHHEQRKTAARKYGLSEWTDWGMILQHAAGAAGLTGQSDGHAEGYAKRSAEINKMLSDAGVNPATTTLEEYGAKRYADGYRAGCTETENDHALERNHTRKPVGNVIDLPGINLKHVGPLNLTVIYGGKSGKPKS